MKLELHALMGFVGEMTKDGAVAVVQPGIDIKQIMYDISVILRSGEPVAIMMGSGSTTSTSNADYGYNYFGKFYLEVIKKSITHVLPDGRIYAATLELSWSEYVDRQTFSVSNIQKKKKKKAKKRKENDKITMDKYVADRTGMKLAYVRV